MTRVGDARIQDVRQDEPDESVLHDVSAQEMRATHCRVLEVEGGVVNHWLHDPGGAVSCEPLLGRRILTDSRPPA